MRVSRLLPCRWMVSACSCTLWLLLGSRRRSWLSPRMTVSGVRNSWVMLVKKCSRIWLICFSAWWLRVRTRWM